MANDKNKETKICEHCGRKLPVSEFALMHCRNYMNVCKECCAKKQKKTRNENDYKKGMELYLADDSMHINRKYKKINRNRTLKKNISGIDFCARDERFVKLLYYKDTWISNYRRVIVYEDGQYKLLRGSVDRWTGEVVYTLK